MHAKQLVNGENWFLHQSAIIYKELQSISLTPQLLLQVYIQKK